MGRRTPRRAILILLFRNRDLIQHAHVLRQFILSCRELIRLEDESHYVDVVSTSEATRRVRGHLGAHIDKQLVHGPLVPLLHECLASEHRISVTWIAARVVCVTIKAIIYVEVFAPFCLLVSIDSIPSALARACLLPRHHPPRRRRAAQIRAKPASQENER